MKTNERVWLLGAGTGIGAAIALNPYIRPRLPLETGVAGWFLAVLIVLGLSRHPIFARCGVLVAGAFLAIPCLLDTTPLLRATLMCAMGLPLLMAAHGVAIGEPQGRWGALTFLTNWSRGHWMARRNRHVDVHALVGLIAAGMVFVVAYWGAQVAQGPELSLVLLRWLAGGVFILAAAEMISSAVPLVAAAAGVHVPPLMRSPFLSRTIDEFWARRWNVFASRVFFRPFFFRPLARRAVWLGVIAAFAASGVVHALLAAMATGRRDLSLLSGAFFLVQPPILLLERQVGVRQKTRSAGHLWTLSWLAVTSPLLVEPMLQIVQPSGGWAGSFGAAGVMVVFSLAVGGVMTGIGLLRTRPSPLSAR